MTAPALHPVALLLRGFAVDFLTGHDVTVPSRIMAPDYRLTIGGHVLAGRDERYLPATATQLERFPGLCVTVHDVVLAEQAAALRFTEHGASLRHDGRVAAWDGVAVFRIAGGLLTSCRAEEDYYARRMQLASGNSDPVAAPHPAPWDTLPAPADPGVEAAARAWLTRGEPVSSHPATANSVTAVPAPADLIDVAETHIDELFSAGDRVAFHLEQRGTYAGGFDDVDDQRVGQPAALRAAGLLTVHGGTVVAAQVTSDRLGLWFSLNSDT